MRLKGQQPLASPLVSWPNPNVVFLPRTGPCDYTDSSLDLGDPLGPLCFLPPWRSCPVPLTCGFKTTVVIPDYIGCFAQTF